MHTIFCQTFYAVAITYLAWAAVMHLIPRAYHVYQDLWVDMGIIDAILVRRWRAGDILTYCDTIDMVVMTKQYTPFLQIVERPATEDEKIKAVGQRLVASMTTPKGVASMRAAVAKAREVAISRETPFKPGDLQRIVETIWRENRV